MSDLRRRRRGRARRHRRKRANLAFIVVGAVVALFGGIVLFSALAVHSVAEDLNLREGGLKEIRLGQNSRIYDKNGKLLGIVAGVTNRTVVGRTLGGATIAMVQGLLVLAVCLLAGFRPQSVFGLLLAFVYMTLIAIVFAALGTAIGSGLRDMQGFQFIMNFLVMPIFFLSGALYPLNNLPTVLAAATRIDPLSYGIDGLRGSLIGVAELGLATDALVLAIVASLFLALGAWAFSRIQI